MSNLDWALAYAAEGFAVLPVWWPNEDGSCSCDGSPNCRPAKHPIPKQGVKQASKDFQRIRAWWDEYPEASVAIATGEASGCIVIDVDTKDGKEGDVSITQACAALGGVPQTLKARSGSGGTHYVYAWRANPFTRKIGFLKDVDYLSEGGYFLVQPSFNLDGAYTFDRDFGILNPSDVQEMRAQMAQLPVWFDSVTAGTGKSKKKDGKARSAQRPSTVAAMEFNREDQRWVTEVRRALTFCDPDSRDLWVLFGIILGRSFERSDDGWALYDEWCARSAKYSDSGTQERMRTYFYTNSTEDPQSGTSAGIGTIFHHASESGWTMPLGGLDSRPTIVYRAGRAIEVTEVIMRIMEAERETEANVTRIFSYGSSLASVIETHDPGMMYTSRGVPPNGWILKVRPYTSMHLGSRITHSATMIKISASGSASQVECPIEVSDHILTNLGKRFPRLNGIVQWPMVLDGALVGVDTDYDPRSGLLYSISPDMDFSALRGNASDGAAAWSWVRDRLLADFPFGTKVDEAGTLAMFLTFMQRRALDIAPAFLVTAPLQGTGKTALVKFASSIVHGRSVGASKMSNNDEEQRKTITAALISNPPAIMFDNLQAGLSFESESVSIAITSSEWEDRKLGHTERLTLPNRAVWCFTGNNITLSADLRRRFVSIRLVPLQRHHYMKHFSRNLDMWAVAHRAECLTMLAAILLCTADRDIKLPTESGFPAWDRAVRWPVICATGIDPYVANSGEENVDDPAEESIIAFMIAWSLLLGEGKFMARDFLEALENAARGSDSSKKRTAQDAQSGIAFLRMKELRNLSPADCGFTIKSLMDRLTNVCGIETSFQRRGMRNGSAVWELPGAAQIAERSQGTF